MRYHSQSRSAFEARREFPYGQLIKLIRMQRGPLNETPLAIAPRARPARRIPILPANQAH
eukprot:9287355-Karenia_brevis.AAC.1